DRARAAERPDVGEREGPAAQVLERGLALTHALGQGGELTLELGQGLPVHVANHRNDQPTIRRHRDAEVVVALEDQLPSRRVEARVELRVLEERLGRGLQEEARQREREAALPRRLDVAADDRVELGDVGSVEVRYVGDERCRERHALGDRAPQVRERVALDRAPLLEPGQRGWLDADGREGLRDGRWRGGGALGGGAGDRGLSAAHGGRPHVVVGHAPAGSRAAHGAEVDAELAREPSRRRRRRRGALCGADGWGGRGQVPGECRFERRDLPPAALLFERHQNRADFDGLPRLHVDLGDAPRDRRRDLDRGLVRLHLEEGCVLPDEVALLDEHLDNLGLGQPLAQVGQDERAGHRLEGEGLAGGGGDTRDVGDVRLLAREADERYVVRGDAAHGRLEVEERALHDGRGDLGAGAEAPRRLVDDDGAAGLGDRGDDRLAVERGDREQVDDLGLDPVLGLEHVGRLAGDAEHGAVRDEREIASLTHDLRAADREGLGIRGDLLLRRVVLDLVEALEGEPGELDLADGLEAVERHADGGADDGGLRERAVDHALRAELALEVIGDAENATVHADVLAEDQHGGVALHLLQEREVERLHHVELGDAHLSTGQALAAHRRRAQRSRGRFGRGGAALAKPAGELVALRAEV